jgi:molybdate transport system permease protein
MRRSAAAPLPWLAGLLVLYLVAPLMAGVQAALATQWSRVDYAALTRACAVSLTSASAATVLTALCGIPLGFLLARVRARAMGLLGFLVQLPLALPPLASGVLLLFLLGYDAPLGRLTHGALTDSFLGIVLAEAFVSAPFVIIAARSAFEAIDPAIEDVAATLGRGPLAVFLHASLPAARPALLAGLLLAWLRAFGEFGATVMVAYHPYSLPVYTYVAFGDQGLPAMLPVLLPAIALAFAIMILSNIVSVRRMQRASRAPTARRTPRAAPPTQIATTGSNGLCLEVEKDLRGFRLAVQWSSSARRLAILGPSGSGKSLTLKLIAGLERPERGIIRIGSRELTRLEPNLRRIGYVPQSYALFPHLDVHRQLLFPAGADPALAAHWLERLGLGELLERRPAQLSLGQQQRVALARALMRPADLLLLDEPLSALDAPLRAAMRRELRTLQAELPVMTLLVTHDPGEALLLADEILVLADGTALQSGPAAHVLRRPVNELAARLLGADNVSEGLTAGPQQIVLGEGVILEIPGTPLPAGRVGWSVPADRIWLHANGRYRGQVESLIEGPLPRAVLRFGEARISAACAPQLAPGQDCRFDLDAERIQVWPLK